MVPLPKGLPLFDNLATARLNLPEVLTKLSAGGLTGYSRFGFPSSTAVAVFVEGNIISALLEHHDDRSLTGEEALLELTQVMTSTVNGALHVSRTSREAALCTHALLHGDRQSELVPSDHSELHAHFSSAKKTGCLLIPTPDDSAPTLIFSNGDGIIAVSGSTGSATSLTDSPHPAPPQVLADFFPLSDIDHLAESNLLKDTDIHRMWSLAAESNQHSSMTGHLHLSSASHSQNFLSLEELEFKIKSIVSDHVGQLGSGAVDKELNLLGGLSLTWDSERTTRFLNGIERTAKLLISTTSIREMMLKLNQVISEVQPGN